MEVILRAHVEHLGDRGEVVKVADGYARNYLLPRKLALPVTAGNRKQIERERTKFDAKGEAVCPICGAVWWRYEGFIMLVTGEDRRSTDSQALGPNQKKPPRTA